MDIKYDFVPTEVGGEKMLVPTGASSVRYKGIITLNDTADFIWRMLPGADNAEDIARALSGEFDVTYEKALADTEKFLGKLEEAGIIAR